MNKYYENICEKNCPDYKGMEELHKEQCDCSCHTDIQKENWGERFDKWMRETSRQWAIRIMEYRDSEKFKLDKLNPNDIDFEFQRGRWSALTDVLKNEFTKDLIKGE